MFVFVFFFRGIKKGETAKIVEIAIKSTTVVANYYTCNRPGDKDTVVPVGHILDRSQVTVKKFDFFSEILIFRHF